MADQVKRSRPAMRHYGIAQGDEGLLAWEWVDGQMAKARNYWICSTRPDGRPHAAPVWGIWHESGLYFGSDPESRKARNFARRPEIVVHLESGDNVVILEGKVEIVTDPGLIAAIDRLYAAKYPPYDPTPSPSYFRLRPQIALAWEERSFTQSATRWEF